MTTPDQEMEDIDQQLKTLSNRASEFSEKGHSRSTYRVYSERRRLAKAHKLVLPYLYSTFYQIGHASTLLEPRKAQEHAIEVLSFLESEDRTREFQSHFDPEAYEYAVSWMTACAYELLSDATGDIEGFNSEGMHTCLSEGIQICRRTGKLGCIQCFHGFGVEVYLASDDTRMALHFARSLQADRKEYMDRGDNRYTAAKQEAWVLLLLGRLKEALEALERGKLLARSEHNNSPWEARVTTIGPLERACVILAGGPEQLLLPTFEGEEKLFGVATRPLPRDEDILFDLKWDQADAILACRDGDYAKAQDILTRWDRWLTEHQGLNQWFEVRLRLIACHRLAGNQNRIEPLAKQLEDRAWKARDWLTLHRLSALFDPEIPPSPLALLAPLDAGPFAAGGPRAAVPAAPPEEAQAEEEAPAPETEEETPPLEETVQQLVQRLDSVEDDEARQALLADVLAIPTADVTHPFDAARLLNFFTYVMGEDDTEVRRTIWDWANAVAAPFPQQPIIMNLLAALGDMLRDDETLEESISEDTLHRLYRESLDLDPFHSRNHYRAGIFYMRRENLGEAERCLARGFRLERDYSPLALSLADVYKQTERPRDALTVLDTCLREGSEDPAVTWQAALSAFGLDQYEPLLTYLDRHEQLAPGAPWINYYRTISLLELGRPDEALAAVEEETRRSPEHPLSNLILRTCALQLLDRADEARPLLADILAQRLADVDYLTFSGLCNLFARLWQTVGTRLPEDDPLRAQLERHLLVTGLAPDDMFEPYRQRETERENIHFYRCLVRQPLDETWPASAGCLAGQEEWTEYLTVWGVLAGDETEARRLAQSWQSRCADLPATVEECEEEDDVYTDRPGVVWQGPRWLEKD
jgi:tetratricopeptide (TPR) repeat protein